MPDTSNETRDTLKQSMERLVADPESYEGFITAINQFSRGRDALSDDLEPDVEALLDTTLQQVSLLDQIESLEGTTTRQLRKFFLPSLLVRDDGLIVTGNDIALERLTIKEGDRVPDLGYELYQAESIADIVHLRAHHAQANSPALLKQAHHAETGRHAVLAFVPTVFGAEKVKGVFLFVIDPLIRRDAVTLIAESYGLTDAETDILAEFGDGKSLNEIAVARARSLATVRTQFQSLLAKTGVRGQSELMRVSQAISHFVSDIDDLDTGAVPIHRKRMTVLRPGGRSIDVIMSGDFAGRPVVYMPGAFLFSFTSDVEAAFRTSGLCVLAVVRPGFGKTDPVPDGQDVATCIAEDICAVLHQVGAASAPFLVHSTGIPITFQAGKCLDGVIEKLVIIGGLAPSDIMARNKPDVAMTAALLKTAGKSMTLLKLLLSARHRLYLHMGAKRFLENQYAKCPVDQQRAIRPDFVADYELAAQILIAQGFGPGTNELLACNANWAQYIPAFPAQVAILHGVQDPLCPIKAMEEFAGSYPDKITLTTLDGVGHFLLHLRPDAVISALQS